MEQSSELIAPAFRPSFAIENTCCWLAWEMEDGDCEARRGAEWKGGAEREGRMRRREAESGRGGSRLQAAAVEGWRLLLAAGCFGWFSGLPEKQILGRGD